ncbi:helix-turn-helix domain-containing protein [Nocardioides sp. JQ2195]|uniref:helix-turn-helix transcriptional regulator n=1 Tax=Nocardioides sp. JQ2195 TaxID=2592334 RepID=UPI00197F9783|nr:helix-turn-helix domain-containing protein [Nocardioides sp. JQ2195]
MSHTTTTDALRGGSARTTTSAPIYLTTEMLAERWEVSPGTLANWRARGTGPTYCKIGNSVRYALADVEQYETAGRTQAVA